MPIRFVTFLAILCFAAGCGGKRALNAPSPRVVDPNWTPAPDARFDLNDLDRTMDWFYSRSLAQDFDEIDRTLADQAGKRFRWSRTIAGTAPYRGHGYVMLDEVYRPLSFASKAEFDGSERGGRSLKFTVWCGCTMNLEPLNDLPNVERIPERLVGRREWNPGEKVVLVGTLVQVRRLGGSSRGQSLHIEAKDVAGVQ